MSTKKTIAMFAVLCLIALGLGYWVGQPKESSGKENAGNPEGKEAGKNEAAPKEPEFLKKGLVAYYPFNGNAKDESGNGRDGDIVGAALCTNRFGIADSACTFSAGNFIRVKDTFGESLTITSWALNVSLTTRQMLWCFGDQITGPDLFFYEGTISLNTWDHVQNSFCSYSLKANVWSHFVTVISPEITELYIDGIRVGRALYRQPSGKPFLINRVDHPWVGQIDDVRIYNRALTEAEVKALYDFEKAK